MIKYEKSEKLLIESIEYQIYLKGNENDVIFSTFIKYRRIKTDKHSSELQRIDGTDQIEFEKLSFSWSYGSDRHIYLYIKAGTKITKLRV
jgi:hypothetical protein